jgi:hypothetical protein
MANDLIRELGRCGIARLQPLDERLGRFRGGGDGAARAPGEFRPNIHQANAESIELRLVRDQPINELLGDKGYDAEHYHRLCRAQLGIPSTIIAVRRNTNGTRVWPSTPYRREMKSSLVRVGYGQRWQIESSISRHKRILRASVTCTLVADAAVEMLVARAHAQMMLLAAA